MVKISGLVRVLLHETFVGIATVADSPLHERPRFEPAVGGIRIIEIPKFVS